jgi:isopenicillin N synthase-like dioxygenase
METHHSQYYILQTDQNFAALLKSGYAEWKNFFDQEHEYKMKFYIKDNIRGFSGSDIETHLSSTRPDEKEWFYYDKQTFAPNNTENTTSKIFDYLSQYANSILENLSKIHNNGLSSLKAVSESLQNNYLLRVLYYPNQNQNLEVGAEHVDINLISLLPRATSKGLQVHNSSNDWDTLDYSDSEILLLYGEMLENLTDGAIKSTKHRVINIDQTQRLSFVFFVNPYDTFVVDKDLTAKDAVSQRINQIILQ